MLPSNAQKLPRAAHSLSAKALGLDEFETLTREKEYLANALVVPVEIYSADEAGEDPKGKSRQASREAGDNIRMRPPFLFPLRGADEF